MSGHRRTSSRGGLETCGGIFWEGTEAWGCQCWRGSILGPDSRGGVAWVPRDWPTDHVTSLVSQVSRAQSTIPGRNACCFLSGMGGGSYLIPGTR